MEEELTEKMHSEFSVSPNTEIRNRVFSLLTLVDYNDKVGIEEFRIMYDLSIENIETYKNEYFKLRNK